MIFKKTLNDIADFIDRHRKTIITGALVILGTIVFYVVFMLSSEEFNVSKEANELVKEVEDRNYSMAINYYDDLENKFSHSKMNRFNKEVSGKINNLLITSGDRLIDRQLSQEQYIGLINTINSLDIDINLDGIVEQAKRVSELYTSENLDDEIATSYINTASTIKGIENSLDIYVQNIKLIKESRNTYNEALNNQQLKRYYEAISSYDEVVKEDKKYYKLSQAQKKECIKLMYDYYIDKAKVASEKGNYEESLMYIEYLKPYYDDKILQNLEDQYKKDLSIYTMTQQDIINLIASKTKKDEKDISIVSYQEMIKGEKFYYVELLQDKKVVDEILVNPKLKTIYSYKGITKDYHTSYSDSYFKIDEGGNFVFSISQKEAKSNLEEKLQNKNNKYKSISKISKEEAKRRIRDDNGYNNLIKKNGNIYYYVLVNKGWFKKKDLYIINMYTKDIYIASKDKLEKY